jgi:2-dehydropantoate 2-reductase
MELTVVGAGAIGGIAGAHLARAGHRVTLVDRDAEHVAAIRRHGLRVSGAAQLCVGLEARLPSEVEGEITTLCLAVKTLHTEEALAPLVPRLAPDGCVVSLQNGLEEARIAALVGAARTVGAFLTFGGYYEGPGHVVYSGPGSLRFGELDGRGTDRVRELARVFSDFHPAEATDNIQGYLWGKLVLGVVYFATATVDADVVDILARPDSRRVLSSLAAEAMTVADALGVRVEPVDGFDPRAFRAGPGRSSGAVDATWQAHEAYWRRGVARRTGIWRDLAVRHRQTEAGPILGALLDAAARADRPVPRVAALSRVIEELEAGRRPLAWDNLFDLE